MSWDVVLFDLDGTLTDSGLGVGNGVLYTLEKMGYPKPNDAELKKFITHDWQAARALAERCAVLEDGRLLALGPTAEVLAGGRAAG